MKTEIVSQILNKAYQGVIKQGGPSVDELGGCKYRGNNGMKCGVGHLIPDALYDPVFDINNGQNGISSLLSGDFTYRRISSALLAGGVPKSADYWLLLIAIQDAHDRAHLMNTTSKGFMDSFKWKMQLLANKYYVVLNES